MLHRIRRSLRRDATPVRGPAHYQELSHARYLPLEIWLEIWQHLPPFARISVTHVCHIWRTTAITSTMLWSHIEINSVRRGGGEPVTCSGCFRINDDWSIGGGMCEQYWACHQQRHHLGIAALSDMLTRSDSVPLHVSVSMLVLGRQQDREDVTRLVTHLRPHLHRLQSLEIICNSMVTVTHIVRDLAVLPALISLVIRRRMFGPVNDSMAIWARYKQISAPILQVIQPLHPSSDPPVFPNLRHVTIGVNSSAALMDLVGGAYGLENLLVDVSPSKVRGTLSTY
ncbi:hypothetical protein BKA62DRAFT_710598 [Auriculariales sp. MPI-PUGE-AT-0066]|nr:hypothetical protein BKA62DRAFT_710598 [Auriculariales sp. MPI-PUGE-AT-0066]